MAGIDDGIGRELQGLEALKSAGEILAADHDAMIFENDAIGLRDGGKLLGDAIPQGFAPRQGIRREGDFAADIPRLRKQSCVRHLAANAEAHERAGMGMDDRINIRPYLVDA
ncbi:MAG TPA: hypothetical protein VGO11_09960 [Chthoniobacteraceae bacterium]|jgi:hypothetical protein|nr:hypothetical protein [Chthoniobacteraceae bacterium]